MPSKFFLTEIRKWLLHLTIIIAVFALAFWLTRFVQHNSVLQDLVFSYGYLGIFAVSVFSGLDFIVPIPAISFVPLFLESGFSFWPTIFIMVLGVTVADTVAYIIGVVLRRVTSESYDSKIVRRLDRLRSRFYWGPVVALFFFALIVPFPNELILLPLGFMGYHLRHLLPVLFLGNGLFTIGAAFGIVSVFHVL